MFEMYYPRIEHVWIMYRVCTWNMSVTINYYVIIDANRTDFVWTEQNNWNVPCQSCIKSESITFRSQSIYLRKRDEWTHEYATMKSKRRRTRVPRCTLVQIKHILFSFMSNWRIYQMLERINNKMGLDFCRLAHWMRKNPWYRMRHWRWNGHATIVKMNRYGLGELVRDLI